jgi:Pretoxin HINT domain/ParB-like nuclease domain
VTIPSIFVGTSVLAFNEKTKLEEAQSVTATTSHGEQSQAVVTLTLETDEKKLEVIETTPEHPFAVRVGQDGEIAWVNAIDIEGGQTLARADGKAGRLISRIVEARDVQLYNLSISEVHNYFVGTNKWLVHNQNQSSSGNFTPGHGLKGDSDTKQVIRLAQEMQANGWSNLPPIKVVMVDGKMVVVDGMHRLEAARLTGTPVVYEIVDEAWLAANTGWKSVAELADDALIPNRASLNSNLLRKAGLGCQ